MIKYMIGDYYMAPVQVIVNPVNTVGVMGKGIALQFKKMYPNMFKQYQKYCEDGSFTIGKLWLYKTNNKWIMNFPTKKSWRNKSKLEYVEKGLQKFVDTYQQKGITSIAFPELGCGNGGLDWKEVKPLMDKYLKNLPIDVYVYENNEKRDKEFLNVEDTKKWIDKYSYDIPFSEFKDDLYKIDGNLPSENEKPDFKMALEMFWSYFSNNLLVEKKDYFFNDEELFERIYTDCKALSYVKDGKIKMQDHYCSYIQLKPTDKSFVNEREHSF